MIRNRCFMIYRTDSRQLRVQNSFGKACLTILASLVGALLLNTIASAVEYSGRTVSTNTNLAPLQEPNYSGYQQVIRIDSRRLVLSLNTGELNELGINNVFTATLELDATVKDQENNVLLHYANLVLSASESRPEQQLVIDLPPDIQIGTAWMTNLALDVDAQPLNLKDFILDRLKLVAEFRSEIRFGTVDANGLDIVPTALSIAPCEDCESEGMSAVTFSWQLPGHETQYFRSYDVEVLKLEKLENSADGYNIEWRRSATYQTSNQQHTMTLSEGSGVYAWRVRGIGDFYEGGRSNSRNIGSWSDHIQDNAQLQAQAFQAINPPGQQTLGTIMNSVFEYNQFDNNRNWIYGRFFSGAGKQKEILTFANGLNQKLQTQTKLFSVDTVIAEQTVYDYSARPAIQCLPAPAGRRWLGYSNQLTSSATGSAYSAFDFDRNDRINSPTVPSLDPSQSGPNSYYSASNTEGASKYVPDAKGYPYSRSLFYSDPLSRIRRQSTPGDATKLNLAPDSRNLQYMYGSSSQAELDRLFGIEAPLSSTVSKNFALDANGVLSVQYVNREGKLIANCLSDAVKPRTLLPVGNENTTFVEDTFDPGIMTPGEFVSRSTKSLVLEEVRPIELDYQITPRAFRIECKDCAGTIVQEPVCKTCDYHVEIEITCQTAPNNSRDRYRKIAFDVSPQDLLDCSQVGNSQPISLKDLQEVQLWESEGSLPIRATGANAALVMLSEGTYSIEKRVYLNNSPPGESQSYLEKVVEEFQVQSDLWTLQANCCCPYDLPEIPDCVCENLDVVCGDRSADCQMPDFLTTLSEYVLLALQAEIDENGNSILDVSRPPSLEALFGVTPDDQRSHEDQIGSIEVWLESILDEVPGIDCQALATCIQDTYSQLLSNLSRFHSEHPAAIPDQSAEQIVDSETNCPPDCPAYYDPSFDFATELQKCLGIPPGDCSGFQSLSIGTSIPTETPDEKPDKYVQLLDQSASLTDSPEDKQLLRNELCIRTYFNDYRGFDPATSNYPLTDYNSLLSSSLDDAIRNTCECTKAMVESGSTALSVTDKIIARCEQGCEEKRAMFAAAIDRYVANYNHRAGVYSPDQLGTPHWRNAASLFNKDTSCLLDILVARCKRQCNLPLANSIDEDRMLADMGYQTYVSGEEFAGLIEAEQREYAEAFLYDADVVPVSTNIVQGPTPEIAQEEMLAFIKSALKRGLIERKKTGTITGGSSPAFDIVLQFDTGDPNTTVPHDPTQLIYFQEFREFLYPSNISGAVDENTEFKKVIVVVNCIWDEGNMKPAQNDFRRLSINDDKVLQYDISFYCEIEQIASFSQFATMQTTGSSASQPCYVSVNAPNSSALGSLYPELNNPYSGFKIDPNLIDIYFDRLGALHVVPRAFGCSGSKAFERQNGIVASNISPIHEDWVYSFELANLTQEVSLSIGIRESESDRPLMLTPIDLDPATDTKAQMIEKIVSSIQSRETGHLYGAHRGDPHSDSPSNDVIYLTLDARSLQHDPSEFTVVFDPSECVQSAQPASFPQPVPIDRLLNFCQEVVTGRGECPYGYNKVMRDGISISDYVIRYDAKSQEVIVAGDLEFRVTQDQQGKLGTIWCKEPLELYSNHNYEFDIKFTNQDALRDRGHGIAFVIQDDPRMWSAKGEGGSGIGYGSFAGDKILPSLCIEFDTRKDPFDNHPSNNYSSVAITYNGDIEHPTKSASIRSLEDGDWHKIKITLFTRPTFAIGVLVDGEVILVDTEQPLGNLPQLQALFGGSHAWWGWTGATNSDATSEQSIQLKKVAEADTCGVCLRWFLPDPSRLVPDLGNFPPQRFMECDEIRENYINEETERFLVNCLSSKLNEIRETYKASCLNSIDDIFKVKHQLGYHHFTLYYYDRAGNLVKTIPPEGVETLSQSQTDVIRQWRADPSTIAPRPQHRLATTYSYNSLHQVISKTTPDGGTMQFWYNAHGQQMLTQDASQSDPTDPSNPRYTYFSYDRLGRLIETGEITGYTPTFVTTDVTQQTINEIWDTHEFPENIGNDRIDILRVTYGVATVPSPYPGLSQRNLRNRISHSWRESEEGDFHTYYSYDPHGNVEWIVQSFPQLPPKTLRYEYDAISCNIDRVIFQENTEEQFMHKYEYNDDNRVIKVLTSKNGFIWDRDVSYSYYLHGPLKRMELGEDSIQGEDYVHTIDGRLKSINQIDLNVSYDPGQDGNDGSQYLRDEFASELTYYRDDYTRANTQMGFAARQTNPNFALERSADDSGYYNGSIRSWASNIRQDRAQGKNPLAINTSVFRYDKLYRVREADRSFYDSTVSSWYAAQGSYDETFVYDANGNISAVTRHGWEYDGRPTDLLIDDLKYTTDNSNSNRLLQIEDKVIGDFGASLQTQPTNNYRYDAKGRLTADQMDGLDIQWNSFDKVKAITNSSSETIRYSYDALGNRAMTSRTNPLGVVTDMSWWVRDPRGNIVAKYTWENTGATGSYTLEEIPIYGASRIGVYRPELPILSGGTTGTASIATHPSNCRRDIRSELSNWIVATGPDASGKSGAQLKYGFGEVTVLDNAVSENSGASGLYMGRNIAVAEDYDRLKVLDFFVTNAHEEPTLVQGLLGEYYLNRSLTGIPEFEREDPIVDFDWGSGSPFTGISDDFSVRWTGFLNVPASGKYRIIVVSDGGARLWIDDGIVINDWSERTEVREEVKEIQLTSGNHSVRLEYVDRTGISTVRLMWQRQRRWSINDFLVGEIVAFTGQFEDTTHSLNIAHLYSESKIRQLSIDSSQATESSSHSMSFDEKDPLFFAGWKGNIRVPGDGNFTFNAKTDGVLKIVVDKKVIFGGDSTSVSKPELLSTISLDSGQHTIEVHYSALTAAPLLDIHIVGTYYWTDAVVIPSTNLLHYSPDLAWLQDSHGELIDVNHYIRAARSHQSIILKAPTHNGVDPQRYFIVTGYKGRLYYHSLLANAEGAIVEHSYQPLFDQTQRPLRYREILEYPFALAGYENHGEYDINYENRTKLFVATNDGFFIKYFELPVNDRTIGQGILVGQIESSIDGSCPECAARAESYVTEMQISPDGSTLASGFAVGRGQDYSHAFALFDIDPLTSPFAKNMRIKIIHRDPIISPSPGYLKWQRPIVTFDFAPDSKSLFFVTQNCLDQVSGCTWADGGEIGLSMIDLTATANVQPIWSDFTQKFAASLRRGLDNRMFLNFVWGGGQNASALLAFGALTSADPVQILNATDKLMLGRGKNQCGIPLQPYRSLSGCVPNPSVTVATRAIDKKIYELRDHIGNVRVAISDCRLATISNGVIAESHADVRAWDDYYTYGSSVPGRSWSSSENLYPLGFQSMERNRDLGVKVSSYFTTFRTYDSRMGRWLSCEPIASAATSTSPYAAFGDDPIVRVDMAGTKDYNVFESQEYTHLVQLINPNVTRSEVLNGVEKAQRIYEAIEKIKEISELIPKCEPALNAIEVVEGPMLLTNLIWIVMDMYSRGKESAESKEWIKASAAYGTALMSIGSMSEGKYWIDQAFGYGTDSKGTARKQGVSESTTLLELMKAKGASLKDVVGSIPPPNIHNKEATSDYEIVEGPIRIIRHEKNKTDENQK